MTALVLGFALGFITAIPIAGPVSALIFSQAMKGAFARARWAALGAAAGEGAYAFLAFWGFNQLFARYSQVFLFLNVAAAIFLAALGVYFLRSRKMRRAQTKHEFRSTSGAVKSIAAGAGVALMNPSVIATWGATIASLFSMDLFVYSNPNAAFFSVGIALGIFVWFVLLLKLIERHRDRLPEAILDRVLKGVGCVLIALAAAMAVRILTHRMG